MEASIARTFANVTPNPVFLDLSKPRYDQSSYWGRVRHFLQVTDMRTLFASDAQLQESIRLVRDYQNGTLMHPVTEEELWKAKKLKDAILHPQTGEKILVPFRMSFQVPGNVLLVAGMLGARSIPSTIFWQTVNQTYNTCVNHANRNASNDLSMNQIATAYLGAVGSSVATAVGLNQAVARSTFSPAIKASLSRFVPFAAVSIASACNVGLMRKNEITLGIEVQDTEGNVLGKSGEAGKLAIMQTAATRVATATPIMIIPPIIMQRLERTAWVKARPWSVAPLTCGVIGVTMLTFLPMCIALFPQKSSVPAQKLEPQFHGLLNKKGTPIETMFYDKGL